VDKFVFRYYNKWKDLFHNCKYGKRMCVDVGKSLG
jgi:hypothetical protein